MTEAMRLLPVDPGMLLGALRAHYEQALRMEPNDPVLRQIIERIASMTAKN
jgi:hypothetical protein